MYQPMIPCPACARHVRATELQCPFCDGPLSAEARARLAPDTTRRLSRAAAFAFGLTVAGCSSTVGNSDAAVDAAAAVDAPAVDRPQGSDAVVAEDRATPPADTAAPDDNGGNVAMYGLPPPVDAGAPDDNGGAVAAYGLPPPVDAGDMGDAGAAPDADPQSAPDAGLDADFGVMPLYGAPPADRWI